MIHSADLRLRFLTLLAAVVAGVCSLVTARQFGAGVLEDSFASRLSTYYRTSAQFMALYGLLNFYLYTMAYVYAPAFQQVYGQRECIFEKQLLYFIIFDIFSTSFTIQLKKQNLVKNHIKIL